MVIVCDKKVVKHLVETGDGLLEIPIRVTFEYALESLKFVNGSMKRTYLYNRKALKKHFPRIDEQDLDREIEVTLDRSLEEGLRYAGQVQGDVELYAAEEEAVEQESDEPPQIILPGS